MRSQGVGRESEETFSEERCTEETRGSSSWLLRDGAERFRGRFRERNGIFGGGGRLHRFLNSPVNYLRREAALSAKVLRKIKILVAAGAAGMAVGAVFGAAAPLAAAAGASLAGTSVGFATSLFAGAGGAGVGKAVGAVVAAASGKTAVALGAATGGVLGGSVGAIAGAEAAGPQEAVLDALGQVSLIGVSAVGVAAGVGGVMGAGAALGTATLVGAETASAGASVAQSSLASAAGRSAAAAAGRVSTGAVTPHCAAAGAALAQEMVVNVRAAAGPPRALCGSTDHWGTAATATRIVTAVADIGKAAASVLLAGGLAVKVVKEKVRRGTGSPEASYSQKNSYEVRWKK